MSFPRIVVRLTGRVLVAFAATLAMQAATAADAPLPVSAFFSNSDISRVRISPSGRYLALTVPASTGRMVLAVVELATDKPPIVIAADTQADVRSFEWVNDERIVYNIADLKVAGYDQMFGPGLFSIRRDGSEVRMLIRSGPRVHAATVANVLGWDHTLLKVIRDGSNDVIVGRVLFNGIRDFIGLVPLRLDVTTGRSSSLAFGTPPNAVSWVFDAKGEPRALVTRSHGVSEVFWREGPEKWRSLLKAPSLTLPWQPYAVDETGQLFVVAHDADSTAVLTRFDVASGRLEKDPIVSTPGFDGFSDLIFDTADQRVVGVRVDTDAETTVWFEPGRKRLQALADARFPDRVVRTTCADCLGAGAMLVQAFSDRDPGTFAVYRPSTGEWTTIGRARPAIDPRQMATVDLHRIKARDGLDLPVWVTTPRGAPSGPRPAVLLVHGGPWARGGHWRWNADAQFLASRGYVVIEPEFRGSLGYGFGHFKAGWKNWGTTMQDDLADAVRWAGDKGLVDVKRVCIAGASYGGYATLMSPIRHPDLYRCGVAWVAVSDPRLLFEPLWRSDMPREAREFSMPTLIGDPVKDAEMLKDAAPVERAREIKIPILMAFGAEDQRVPIDHGTRMRAAIRAAGNEPEYVVYSGEGHGWLKVENRVDFWTRVEKFLARHLN